jgi:DNA-binding response OmpR family regulator
MPHYTGYELIKTVRATSRTKDMAVAMLTGVREKSSIEKAIKVGVDDYIVKPIEPLVFMKKVEELLLRKPPKKQLELAFSNSHKLSTAKLTLDCKLISLSEYGLRISSSQSLQDGNLIGLQTQLFEQIGIEVPAMRILSSERTHDEYIFNIAFIGLNESSSEKLKFWIQNEINKKVLKIA